MFCTNCGKEFNGNFCPYCGTQSVTEVKCPNCGRTREADEKFCADCGYRFDSHDSAPAANYFGKPNRTASLRHNVTAGTLLFKLYSLLYYLPAIAFVLFSLSVFAFYAAPIATTPAIKDLEIPAESLGNVYGISKDLPDLKGYMIGLIAFAVFNAIAAILLSATAVKNDTKLKTVSIGDKKVQKGYIFYITEAVLSLVFFIVGIVMQVRIKNFAKSVDDDLILVGACPKLLIAFSIITFIFIVGAVIGRVCQSKVRPNLSDAEHEKCIATDNRKIEALQEARLSLKVDERLNLPLSEKEIDNYALSRSANKTLFIILIFFVLAILLAATDFIISISINSNKEFVSIPINSNNESISIPINSNNESISIPIKSNEEYVSSSRIFLVFALITIFISLIFTSLSGLWVGNGKVMKKRAIIAIIAIVLAVASISTAIVTGNKLNNYNHDSYYYNYYNINKCNETLNTLNEDSELISKWKNDFEAKKDDLIEYDKKIRQAYSDGTIDETELEPNKFIYNTLYINEKSTYITFLYSAQNERTKLLYNYGNGQYMRGSSTLFDTEIQETEQTIDNYIAEKYYKIVYAPLDIPIFYDKEPISAEKLINNYDLIINELESVITNVNNAKKELKNNIETYKEYSVQNKQGNMTLTEYSEYIKKTKTEEADLKNKLTVRLTISIIAAFLFIIITFIISITGFVKLCQLSKNGKTASTTIKIIKNEVANMPKLTTKKSSLISELSQYAKEKNYEAFSNTLSQLHNEFLVYIEKLPLQ